MQQASGLDFEKYHCRRVDRIQNLLESVVKNHAVFVKAPSASGKSSLAQLVMEYCKENKRFRCFFINALIDVTQEEGKQYSLSDFSSKKLPSLVIIDEVHSFYNQQQKLWNGIKSILQKQMNPPIYFILFSSESHISNPIINDIKFPIYYGMGLLKCTEEESNELFESFRSHYKEITNQYSLPNISKTIEKYILRITSGNIGQITTFLNSLWSTLFLNQLNEEKEQQMILDENWFDGFLFQWFRSYHFYSILLSSRGNPNLSNLSKDEQSSIDRLLIRYHTHPNACYVRLNESVMNSLHQKQVIRNADETLLGNSFESSVGSDATLISPLTSHMILQSVERTPITEEICDTPQNNIITALQSINPLSLQKNAGQLQKIPFLFCKEFYERLGSLYSYDSFLSVHIHPISMDDKKKAYPLFDIYISDNDNNSTAFVICNTSSFPLSENQWKGFKKNTTKLLSIPNGTNIIYLFCSFPSCSITTRESPSNIDIIDENVFQAFIRQDLSSILIYGPGIESSREIIFTGHINSYNTGSNTPQFLSPVSISSPKSRLIESPTIIHESELVKLFVGQIPRTFTEDNLRSMFEPFGDIYELSILYDKQTGNHQGCGFVTYTSPTSAEQAIKNLHGLHTFPGQNRPMQIKIAESEDQKSEHKLFVGMIPESITEKQLRKLFSKYGKVKELVILKNLSGESKGCGFVKYSTHYDALGAINALNRSFIKNFSTHPLVVKFADSTNDNSSRLTWHPPHPYIPYPVTPIQPIPFHTPIMKKDNRTPRTGPSGCNLFILGIPQGWTDNDLWMRFVPFGNVVSASVFVDKATNISKGFGFVSYDNPSSARLAIQNLDGTRINGKRLTVQFKKRTEPY